MKAMACIAIIFVMMMSTISAKKALVLVDIQNDYFLNGKYPLVGMEEASQNAKLILDHFRSENLPVVFIQHVNDYAGATFFIPGTWGDQISDVVNPLSTEPVVVKHFPNSFRNTTLQQELTENQVTEVVIVGAMSHMCIDSTTRAAADLGYNVTLIDDACATRDLEFNGTLVKAAEVHATYMGALGAAFAAVISTEEYLKTESWREELRRLSRNTHSDNRDKALILVDIQNDYFSNGKYPLVGMEEASLNAKLILEHFRSENLPVVFIQHVNDYAGAPFFIPGTWGDQISDVVKPIFREFIAIKHFPNSFRNTTLQEELVRYHITDVVIVGAMSHMCIDSTARAAADLGYNVTVINDACATRDIEFNGTDVQAADVHAASMAALQSGFATVLSTEDYLKEEYWREELESLINY